MKNMKKNSRNTSVAIQSKALKSLEAGFTLINSEEQEQLVKVNERGGYHLMEDHVDPALTALTNSELQQLFDEIEMRLGCEFAHLLRTANRPFVSKDDTDWIVMEAWCESGENHTPRIKAMLDLHQRADEMLRDRGLDPYR
jgi:hypothetical protein